MQRISRRISATLVGIGLCMFATMPAANAVNDVTGSITPNGAAVMKTTTTTDQNIVLSFSLGAARKVSVRFTGSSFTGGSVSVVDATSTTRSTRSLVGSTGFVEPVRLPAGSYTVLIDPSGSQVGSITTELFAVNDVTGPIATDGSSTAAATTRPGQDIRLRFAGTAGQRVSLRVSNVVLNGSSLSVASCCAMQAAILRPNGTVLGGSTNAGTTSPAFLDPVTLPTTGRYTVLLNPDRDTVLSNVTANLWIVPADVTGPIATNGSAVTTGTSTPGQDIRLTFAGVAGHRAAYEISNIAVNGPSQSPPTCCAVQVSLLRPNGSVVSGPSGAGTSSPRFVDPVDLNVNGTYTLLISPQKDTVLSSVTAELWDVPADVKTTVATNGTAHNDATTTPGQAIRLRFSGTAGDRIGFRVTNVTTAGPSLATDSCCALEGSLLDPNGTPLTGPSTIGTSAPRFFEPVTLPVTGTYTVLLDPRVDAVLTSVRTNVWLEPADVSAAIADDGTPLTRSTTTPGQDIRLTFSGTAGERVSLRVDNIAVSGSTLATSTCCAAEVAILRSNGTTVANAGPSNAGTATPRFFDAVTLPANDTYTVLISPQKDAVLSSVRAQLWNVPNDITLGASIDGGGVGVSTTTPGQNARITFTGSAGDSIHIAFSGVSAAPGSLALSTSLLKASLLRPDLSTLVSPTSVGTSGKTISATLATSGTYTLVIDPVQDAVVNATVTISHA